MKWQGGWDTVVDRGAWRRWFLTKRSITSVVRGAGGYTIGMRPYTDSAWTQHALHQEAEQLLGVYQADGYDLFVIIGGEDTPLMRLAHADLYHNWLGAYAADVDAELIDLFAFVKTVDSLMCSLPKHKDMDFPSIANEVPTLFGRSFVQKTLK